MGLSIRIVCVRDWIFNLRSRSKLDRINYWTSSSWPWQCRNIHRSSRYNCSHSHSWKEANFPGHVRGNVWNCICCRSTGMTVLLTHTQYETDFASLVVLSRIMQPGGGVSILICPLEALRPSFSFFFSSFHRRQRTRRNHSSKSSSPLIPQEQPSSSPLLSVFFLPCNGEESNMSGQTGK